MPSFWISTTALAHMVPSEIQVTISKHGFWLKSWLTNHKYTYRVHNKGADDANEEDRGPILDSRSMLSTRHL